MRGAAAKSAMMPACESSSSASWARARRRSGAGSRAATGWPYYDNDRLVEAASGRAAPELVREEGEAGLHAAEMAAFEYALTLPQPVIVSGAGYVVTDADARKRLRSSDVVVWLKADPATLAERASHADGAAGRGDVAAVDRARRGRARPVVPGGGDDHGRHRDDAAERDRRGDPRAPGRRGRAGAGPGA